MTTDNIVSLALNSGGKLLWLIRTVNGFTEWVGAPETLGCLTEAEQPDRPEAKGDQFNLADLRGELKKKLNQFTRDGKDGRLVDLYHVGAETEKERLCPTWCVTMREQGEEEEKRGGSQPVGSWGGGGRRGGWGSRLKRYHSIAHLFLRRPARVLYGLTCQGHIESRG